MFFFILFGTVSLSHTYPFQLSFVCFPHHIDFSPELCNFIEICKKIKPNLYSFKSRLKFKKLQNISTIRHKTKQTNTHKCLLRISNYMRIYYIY